MAFVRIKTVNSPTKRHNYIYIVKSTWDKKRKQSRQQTILCMGDIIGAEPTAIECALNAGRASCANCGRQDNLAFLRGEKIFCSRCGHI